MDISWYEIQVPLDPAGAPWLNDARWQEMLRGILSLCDEKLARQICGLLSLCLERGGQRRLAEIAGLCEQTVSRGRKELLGEVAAPAKDRMRLGSPGRKKCEELDPQIEVELLEIVEAHKAGDPARPDVWAGQSLAKLQTALKERGHGVSKNTLRRLLKKTRSPSLETGNASPVHPTLIGTSSSIG
jgi:hypothetical protein